MYSRIAFTLIAGSLLVAGGCGDNRMVGHRMVREDTWLGEFGVVGNLNEVRIRTGSNLTTLKIVGDANKIHVEDRVPVGKIEIWGENNEVSIPAYLRVRDAIVGKGNKIIRRGPEAVQPATPAPFEPAALPPEEPPVPQTGQPPVSPDGE
jgi:hypothetical protein